MKFVYFIPYFIPLAVLLIGIEVFISVRNKLGLYNWKDSKASAIVGIGAVVIQVLTKAATLGVFFVMYELFEPLRLKLGYSGFGGAWWVWLAAVVCDDFCFYWHHRLSHTVRVLWAAHIVHHSSSYFNLGSAFRNGWVIFFYKPVFWLWMPAIGFHPVIVLSAMAINSLYQFGLHTQRIPSLGWIEKIMNTPYLHQIHHSRNPNYIDKNHGGIFIIWDRLFGSYHAGHTVEKKVFGVTTPPASFATLEIISHEYGNIWNDTRKARRFSDKLKYIFYPPGWSHDGSTLTARQMEERRKNAGSVPSETRSETTKIISNKSELV